MTYCFLLKKKIAIAITIIAFVDRFSGYRCTRRFSLEELEHVKSNVDCDFYNHC